MDGIMDEALSSLQGNLDATSSGINQDEATGTIQEIIQDSLAKLNLPSTSSGRPINQLRRSLSYPSIFTQICKECNELCVCPNLHYLTNKDDKNLRRSKTVRQTKISLPGGERIHFHKQTFAKMPKTSESTHFMNLVLLDFEPRVVNDRKVLQDLTEYTECQVCFIKYRRIRQRECCGMPVCEVCIQTYIREKVNRRVVIIRCLNPACHSFIFKDEILHHLSSELYEKFLRYLVEDNSDPSQKTCPQCNRIAHFDNDVTIRPSTQRSTPDDQEVACPCGLLWCYRCQAPWHHSMTCQEYITGDLLFKEWAKDHIRGQPNAKRCPKCKVYIQRSSGCDTMTCSRCQTQFCYRCGGRYYSSKYFGNHFSRLSVFGCKYRYRPNEPIKRRMIRGVIFGCQLLAAPIWLAVVVGFGGVLLIAIGPAYAVYRFCRYFKHKRCKLRYQQRQLENALQMRLLEENTGFRNGRSASKALTPRPATLIDLPPSPWQLY